jgi:ribonuclease VapC
MIVVDASALVAMLRGEAKADEIRKALIADPDCVMAPVNWLEARIVAERHDAVAEMERLRAIFGIVIVPTDEAQSDAAWNAFKSFGKGRHAAALNLADCFVYALARICEAPLLFVGADFAKTDIRPALT